MIHVRFGRPIDVEGPGPRLPGAAMAVSEDGEVAGSVSGGCVEGAVLTEALEVIAAWSPRLLTYGIADEEAFAVGLTCGGTIHVFAQPLDWSLYEQLGDAIRAEEPVVCRLA